MAEVPQPKFEVGQRVWDIDGRNGLVSEAIFAQAVNGFRYLVDGINDIFEESELRDRPFGLSERLTDRQRLESRLVAALIGNPGLDVRFWVGRELDVPDDVLDEAPPQVEGGTLVDALAFWAARGFFLPDETPSEPPEPPPEEPPPVIVGLTDAELEAILAEVDERIARSIGPVVANSILARNQLEARVVEQMAELRSDLRAIQESAEEATGTDLSGLFRVIGTLISDPLGFLLDRAEDAILGEVADGLNR